MAEGGHAVAVDTGDSARAGERDVAGGERDGNGRARAEGRRRSGDCRLRIFARSGGRAAAEGRGGETESGKLRSKEIGHGGAEAAEGEGRRDSSAAATAYTKYRDVT